MSDLFEHGCLAGLGWADDQPSLSETNWGEEVHHAGGKFTGGRLEDDLPLREYGREMLEDGAIAAVNLIGSEAVDLLYTDQSEIPLSLLGRADLAGDGISGPQSEASDLGLGDVDIARGAVAGNLAEEAVPFVHSLKNAGCDKGLLG